MTETLTEHMDARLAVTRWCADHLGSVQLHKQAHAGMMEARSRGMVDEEGGYIAIAHTIGSGAHGSQLIPVVLGEVLEIEDPDTLNEDQRHEYMDLIGVLVPQYASDQTPLLPGKFYCGFYEADGSYCLFYTENDEHIEQASEEEEEPCGECIVCKGPVYWSQVTEMFEHVFETVDSFGEAALPEDQQHIYHGQVCTPACHENMP